MCFVFDISFDFMIIIIMYNVKSDPFCRTNYCNTNKSHLNMIGRSMKHAQYL